MFLPYLPGSGPACRPTAWDAGHFAKGFSYRALWLTLPTDLLEDHSLPWGKYRGTAACSYCSIESFHPYSFSFLSLAYKGCVFRPAYPKIHGVLREFPRLGERNYYRLSTSPVPSRTCVRPKIRDQTGPLPLKSSHYATRVPRFMEDIQWMFVKWDWIQHSHSFIQLSIFWVKHSAKLWG